MKKITFWEVFQNRVSNCAGCKGWQCAFTKENGFEFPSRYTKDTERYDGVPGPYTPAECKVINADLSDAKRQFKAYVKGLKILFKNNFYPGSCESMVQGEKDRVDLIARFHRLIYSFNNGTKDIIKIGMGSKYSITDYVDGSFVGYIRD